MDCVEQHFQCTFTTAQRKNAQSSFLVDVVATQINLKVKKSANESVAGDKDLVATACLTTPCLLLSQKAVPSKNYFRYFTVPIFVLYVHAYAMEWRKI